MSRNTTPIGLDAGPRAIAAVQLDWSGGGGPVITAAAIVARQSATDVPLSSSEAAALEEVLYRQGFTGRDVVVGVPDHAMLTEVLELPPRSSGAPVEQLARMEIARTHKRDPASFQLACWDVPAPPRAPARGPADSAGGTHIMTAACAHADADALLDALESSGFRVRALDARAWALARACRSAIGVSGLGAILDIGEHAALLALVHSGTLVYQRPMRDSGLGRLRARIREELGITPDLADYLMDTLGPRTTTPAPEKPALHRSSDAARKDAAALLEDYIQSLSAEVRTALDYATHRYPGTVGHMAIAGAGAAIPSLGERLSKSLGLSARPIAPSDAASSPPALSALCRDPALIAALGLALWDPAAAAGAQRRAA